MYSEDTLRYKLESWWSNFYQRPLKDPLLQSYTIEELLYEYHDKVERRLAEDESTEEDADRMEEKRIQENLDWAEQEELKELEELKRKEEEERAKREHEEQLNKLKEMYGDDFGEDINEDF